MKSAWPNGCEVLIARSMSSFSKVSTSSILQHAAPAPTEIPRPVSIHREDFSIVELSVPHHLKFLFHIFYTRLRSLKIHMYFERASFTFPLWWRQDREVRGCF